MRLLEPTVQESSGNIFRSLRWVSFLQVTLCISLLVYLFYPVMYGLVIDWWNSALYSYGFLIPLISCYLLWNRREDFKECSKRPSLVGLSLFLFGLVVYVLGSAGEEELMQRFSIPIILIGLVYFLAGKKMAQFCLVPIGYLFIMIPFPFILYKAFSLELRLFDAAIVASWSSFLGVPIFQEGYLLHLPYITLEVADVCSGVLSIVSLLVLGALYIYIIQMQRWKKILLGLFLIPVAILSNVIRILLIVIFIHYSGDWILNTTFHKYYSLFNFLMGFMTVILAGFLLNRIPWEKESKR